jgi:hypothetical protein
MVAAKTGIPKKYRKLGLSGPTVSFPFKGGKDLDKGR